MSSGFATLKVVRAQLTNQELIGSMDPFVKVRSSSGEFRTQVAQNQGTNPVWNESFNVPAAGDVNLSIWDKDTLSADDFLADTTINPQALLTSGQSATWHPVYKKGKQLGQLYVEVYSGGVIGGTMGQGPLGGFQSGQYGHHRGW